MTNYNPFNCIGPLEWWLSWEQKHTNMQIKNNYNKKKFESDHEKTDPISKTVPDMALSMREILDRYARGLPTDGQEKIAMYHGDDMPPDIERMDLSEREELREEVNLQVRRQQAALKKQEQVRQQEERQKDFLRWKEKEDKEIADKTQGKKLSEKIQKSPDEK